MASYAEFVSPVDASAISQKMLGRVDDYTQYIQIHEQLCEALAKFDGKKITKRMATAATEALGRQCRIKHGPITYMCVQVGDVRHFQEERYRLAQDQAWFGLQSFKTMDTVQNLRAEIPKIQSGLPLIDSFARRCNEILKQAQELVKEATPYGLEYDFDLIHLGDKK